MPYQRLYLSARPSIAGVKDTLKSLLDHLSNRQIELYCRPSTQKLLNSPKLTTLHENELDGRIDLIVVIGGDGSMLSVAEFASAQGIPVIGINRGRLGFLTDICPSTLQQIDDVLDGKHLTENRFIIQAHNPQGNTPKQIALNDVVLQSGGYAQMIAFDVFVNDEPLYKHRADGLIIATPTGSTAYALSGGGPILQPELPAVAIVPMFPHTLSSRPIVVSAESTIRISISPNQQSTPLLSCDGNPGTPIQPGEDILVSLHNKRLTLLHPEEYNYFNTLREKLNWEQCARHTHD